MLQIASGRFFKRDDRYVHDGKGILYSNYGWVAPIVTCVGTLEPVDWRGAVRSYVFSYKNQIEKMEGSPRPGEVVRVGDDEIIRQFQLLCMLGLRAYFAADRTNVLANCRSRPLSSSDQIVPSAFVTRLLDGDIRGSVADGAALVSLVESVITLPRKTYSAVINVLENLDHALQSLNWNIDLAYSMLVYCLESLSQAFDAYTPVWTDYDDKIRAELDQILLGVGPGPAELVRTTLLKGAHLKLAARFIQFVSNHVTDGFFTSEATSVSHALSRSHLGRVLRNAYALRSNYVHRLQPIREQLRSPQISGGDVLTWDGEPYLTLRGLMRLVLHVIKTFIDRQPHSASEEFNWRSDLPGILRLKAAPQYWIWDYERLDETLSSEHFAEHVRAKLGGLFSHIVDVVRNGGALTDLRGLLGRYKEREKRAPERDRIRMWTTYFLFNRLVAEEHQSEEWEPWDTGDRCWVETMVAELIVREELNEPYEECRRAYDDYVARRFEKNTVEIPRILEIKLLCELANKALAAGRRDDFDQLNAIAITEAAGMPDVQARLETHRTGGTPIEHHAIFTADREPSKSPEAAAPDTSQQQGRETTS